MGKKSKKGQMHHAQHEHHKTGEGTHGHHHLHDGTWYKSHHTTGTQSATSSDNHPEPLSETPATDEATSNSGNPIMEKEEGWDIVNEDSAKEDSTGSGQERSITVEEAVRSIESATKMTQQDRGLTFSPRTTAEKTPKVSQNYRSIEASEEPEEKTSNTARSLNFEPEEAVPPSDRSLGMDYPENKSGNGMLSYNRLMDDWKAIFGAALFNWEQDRSYNASSWLSKERKVGFTEVWGIDQPDEAPGLVDTSIADEFDTQFCQSTLVLLQHRPAWAEQIVLRASGLDYVVKNVNYAVQESTGPLPCLVDTVDEQKPILVGRKAHGRQNAILAHLKNKRGVKLDPEPAFAGQSLLLGRLLIDRLPVCLVVLRYKDRHAWYQINRSQSLESYARGKASFISGLFQTWCERHFAICSLPHEAYQWNKEEAVAIAEESYRLFENQIKSQTNGSEVSFLFSQDQITFTDALLFEHLMQALSDVHLVRSLASFPILCKYTERLWNTFMEKSIVSDNDLENTSNPFCNTPFTPKNKSLGEEFSHALDLMQSLAIGRDSLQQRLTLLAERQSAILAPKKQSTTTKKTPTVASDTDEGTTQADDAVKSHKQGDELWLAFTFVGTAAAFSYALISARSAAA